MTVKLAPATEQAMADLWNHAANCAVKLAATAQRCGATDDEAVRIGVDLFGPWLRREMTSDQANAEARRRGFAAARARGQQ